MRSQASSLKIDTALSPPGQRLCVAVSGGADSVALLRGLLDRHSAMGLVLSMVHVHHGIRAGEADRDQAFVEALAQQHQLPLHLSRVDTPGRARQYQETQEEAARQLRYDSFRSLLQAGVVDAVATAHTLDDQAETVLQKLMRGAWTEGLGGISPVVQQPGGSILRPLLHTARAEVEAYLVSIGQPWCEDSTNLDLRHTRNRVRHALLPGLRSFNPQIASQLSHLAAIARDEEAYWQKELARIGPGLVLPGKPVRGGGRSSSTHPEEATLALELERLRGLAVALQRRLLRWAAQQMGATLSFEDTERLMQLCQFGRRPEGANGKRLDLPGGVSAQRTARELQLSLRAPKPAPAPGPPRPQG